MKIGLKNISRLVLRDIVVFFPLFLLLYIVIYITSFFLLLSQSFWQTPSLHFSLTIFGSIFFIAKINYFYEHRRDFRFNTEYILQISKEVILWMINLIKSVVLSLVISCIRIVKSFPKRVKYGYFIPWITGTAVFLLILCLLFLVLRYTNLAWRSVIIAFYLLIVSFVLMVINGLFDKQKAD